MNQALFTGLSGTVTYQTNLSVVSSNIVNANTKGYKEARTVFKDLLYRTLRSAMASGNVAGRGGSDPVQVGSGVGTGAIQVAMAQGSLQQTSQPLDAAVDGEGLFVLGGAEALRFTREGAFTLDDANTLVSATSGLKVQGWLARGGVVDTTTDIGDLTFEIGRLRPAFATRGMRVGGNLDADAALGTVVTTGINVYDSLGSAHRVTLNLTKTDVGEWAVQGSCGADTVTGRLTFGPDGSLTGGSPITFDITTATGATTPLSVNMDFASMTQLARASSAVVESQDGSPSAALVRVELGAGGAVLGRYSDGVSEVLGQVALATFANAAGLARTGDNLYTASAATGRPQIGAPLTGGRGEIVPAALELSNVDLTRNLVEMVTTQRGFQASANTIITANRMLEQAIDITQR